MTESERAELLALAQSFEQLADNAADDAEWAESDAYSDAERKLRELIKRLS